MRNHDEKIIASTFEKGVPPDLMKLSSPQCPPQCTAKQLAAMKAALWIFALPIAGGYAGSVQIGVLDTIVLHELDSLRNKVLWALFLCATIGIAYALMLTGILTRPIHHLVQAANRIREGQFRDKGNRVFER